jgi:CheY-like chemotaxis protein
MDQAQPQRTVLIVEDDAELHNVTAALLEDEQLDTIECESAEAALVRLPDVMDGVDLAWGGEAALAAASHGSHLRAEQ